MTQYGTDLLLKILVEDSPNGLYLVGQDGKLKYANNRIAELLGATSRDDLLNDTTSGWYAEKDDWRNIQDKIIESGEISGYQCKWMNKTGERVLIRENLKAVLTPEGSYAGYQGVVEVVETDRSGESDMEMLINERTAQLEAANKELEAFSYSVSHDLQTPIRHIYSFGELLKNRAGKFMDEKSNLFLQNILDSSQSMSDLIEGLLSFSRIGRSEIKKTRIELVHLIEAVRDDFLLDCAGRDIEWNIGGNCELYADLQLIRQVAVNLIGNALKYTSGNDKTIIEAGSRVQGNYVTVFIRDNGVGFNMKYADRLFRVFQRLHSKEEFEGTGIGLANVKRIITRHGGRVWAEGEEGKGATFYFSLPVDKE